MAFFNRANELCGEIRARKLKAIGAEGKILDVSAKLMDLTLGLMENLEKVRELEMLVGDRPVIKGEFGVSQVPCEISHQMKRPFPLAKHPPLFSMTYVSLDKDKKEVSALMSFKLDDLLMEQTDPTLDLGGLPHWIDRYLFQQPEIRWSGRKAYDKLRTDIAGHVAAHNSGIESTKKEGYGKIMDHLAASFVDILGGDSSGPSLEDNGTGAQDKHKMQETVGGGASHPPERSKENETIAKPQAEGIEKDDNFSFETLAEGDYTAKVESAAENHVNHEHEEEDGAEDNATQPRQSERHMLEQAALDKEKRLIKAMKDESKNIFRWTEHMYEADRLLGMAAKCVKEGRMMPIQSFKLLLRIIAMEAPKTKKFSGAQLDELTSSLNQQMRRWEGEYTGSRPLLMDTIWEEEKLIIAWEPIPDILVLKIQAGILHRWIFEESGFDETLMLHNRVVQTGWGMHANRIDPNRNRITDILALHVGLKLMSLTDMYREEPNEDDSPIHGESMELYVAVNAAVEAIEMMMPFGYLQKKNWSGTGRGISTILHHVLVNHYLKKEEWESVILLIMSKIMKRPKDKNPDKQRNIIKNILGCLWDILYLVQQHFRLDQKKRFEVICHMVKSHRQEILDWMTMGDKRLGLNGTTNDPEPLMTTRVYNLFKERLKRDKEEKELISASPQTRDDKEVDKVIDELLEKARTTNTALKNPHWRKFGIYMMSSELPESKDIEDITGVMLPPHITNCAKCAAAFDMLDSTKHPVYTKENMYWCLPCYAEYAENQRRFELLVKSYESRDKTQATQVNPSQVKEGDLKKTPTDQLTKVDDETAKGATAKPAEQKDLDPRPGNVDKEGIPRSRMTINSIHRTPRGRITTSQVDDEIEKPADVQPKEQMEATHGKCAHCHGSYTRKGMRPLRKRAVMMQCGHEICHKCYTSSQRKCPECMKGCKIGATDTKYRRERKQKVQLSNMGLTRKEQLDPSYIMMAALKEVKKAYCMTCREVNPISSMTEDERCGCVKCNDCHIANLTECPKCHKELKDWGDYHYDRLFAMDISEFISPPEINKMTINMMSNSRGTGTAEARLEVASCGNCRRIYRRHAMQIDRRCGCLKCNVCATLRTECNGCRRAVVPSTPTTAEIMERRAAEVRERLRGSRLSHSRNEERDSRHSINMMSHQSTQTSPQKDDCFKMMCDQCRQQVDKKKLGQRFCGHTTCDTCGVHSDVCERCPWQYCYDCREKCQNAFGLTKQCGHFLCKECQRTAGHRSESCAKCKPLHNTINMMSSTGTQWSPQKDGIKCDQCARIQEKDEVSKRFCGHNLCNTCDREDYCLMCPWRYCEICRRKTSLGTGGTRRCGHYCCVACDNKQGPDNTKCEKCKWTNTSTVNMLQSRRDPNEPRPEGMQACDSCKCHWDRVHIHSMNCGHKLCDPCYSRAAICVCCPSDRCNKCVREILVSQGVRRPCGHFLCQGCNRLSDPTGARCIECPLPQGFLRLRGDDANNNRLYMMNNQETSGQRPNCSRCRTTTGRMVREACGHVFCLPCLSANVNRCSICRPTAPTTLGDANGRTINMMSSPKKAKRIHLVEPCNNPFICSGCHVKEDLLWITKCGIHRFCQKCFDQCNHDCFYCKNIKPDDSLDDDPEKTKTTPGVNDQTINMTQRADLPRCHSCQRPAEGKCRNGADQCNDCKSKDICWCNPCKVAKLTGKCGCNSKPTTQGGLFMMSPKKADELETEHPGLEANVNKDEEEPLTDTTTTDIESRSVCVSEREKVSPPPQEEEEDDETTTKLVDQIGKIEGLKEKMKITPHDDTEGGKHVSYLYCSISSTDFAAINPDKVGEVISDETTQGAINGMLDRLEAPENDNTEVITMDGQARVVLNQSGEEAFRSSLREPEPIREPAATLPQVDERPVYHSFERRDAVRRDRTCVTCKVNTNLMDGCGCVKCKTCLFSQKTDTICNVCNQPVTKRVDDKDGENLDRPSSPRPNSSSSPRTINAVLEGTKICRECGSVIPKTSKVHNCWCKDICFSCQRKPKNGKTHCEKCGYKYFTGGADLYQKIKKDFDNYDKGGNNGTGGTTTGGSSSGECTINVLYPDSKADKYRRKKEKIERKIAQLEQESGVKAVSFSKETKPGPKCFKELANAQQALANLTVNERMPRPSTSRGFRAEAANWSSDDEGAYQRVRDVLGGDQVEKPESTQKKDDQEDESPTAIVYEKTVTGREKRLEKRNQASGSNSRGKMTPSPPSKRRADFSPNLIYTPKADDDISPLNNMSPVTPVGGYSPKSPTYRPTTPAVLDNNGPPFYEDLTPEMPQLSPEKTLEIGKKRESSEKESPPNLSSYEASPQNWERKKSPSQRMMTPERYAAEMEFTYRELERGLKPSAAQEGDGNLGNTISPQYVPLVSPEWSSPSPMSYIVSPAYYPSPMRFSVESPENLQVGASPKKSPNRSKMTNSPKPGPSRPSTVGLSITVRQPTETSKKKPIRVVTRYKPVVTNIWGKGKTLKRKESPSWKRVTSPWKSSWKPAVKPPEAPKPRVAPARGKLPTTLAELEQEAQDISVRQPPRWYHEGNGTFIDFIWDRREKKWIIPKQDDREKVDPVKHDLLILKEQWKDNEVKNRMGRELLARYDWVNADVNSPQPPKRSEEAIRREVDDEMEKAYAWRVKGLRLEKRRVDESGKAISDWMDTETTLPQQFSKRIYPDRSRIFGADDKKKFIEGLIPHSRDARDNRLKYRIFERINSTDERSLREDGKRHVEMWPWNMVGRWTTKTILDERRKTGRNIFWFLKELDAIRNGKPIGGEMAYVDRENLFWILIQEEPSTQECGLQEGKKNQSTQERGRTISPRRSRSLEPERKRKYCEECMTFKFESALRPCKLCSWVRCNTCRLKGKCKKCEMRSLEARKQSMVKKVYCGECTGLYMPSLVNNCQVCQTARCGTCVAKGDCHICRARRIGMRSSRSKSRDRNHETPQKKMKNQPKNLGNCCYCLKPFSREGRRPFKCRKDRHAMCEGCKPKNTKECELCRKEELLRTPPGMIRRNPRNQRTPNRHMSINVIYADSHGTMKTKPEILACDQCKDDEAELMERESSEHPKRLCLRCFDVYRLVIQHEEYERMTDPKMADPAVDPVIDPEQRKEESANSQRGEICPHCEIQYEDETIRKQDRCGCWKCDRCIGGSKICSTCNRDLADIYCTKCDNKVADDDITAFTCGCKCCFACKMRGKCLRHKPRKVLRYSATKICNQIFMVGKGETKGNLETNSTRTVRAEEKKLGKVQAKHSVAKIGKISQSVVRSDQVGMEVDNSKIPDQSSSEDSESDSDSGSSSESTSSGSSSDTMEKEKQDPDVLDLQVRDEDKMELEEENLGEASIINSNYYRSAKFGKPNLSIEKKARLASNRKKAEEGDNVMIALHDPGACDSIVTSPRFFVEGSYKPEISTVSLANGDPVTVYGRGEIAIIHENSVNDQVPVTTPMRALCCLDVTHDMLREQTLYEPGGVYEGAPRATWNHDIKKVTVCDPNGSFIWTAEQPENYPHYMAEVRFLSSGQVGSMTDKLVTSEFIRNNAVAMHEKFGGIHQDQVKSILNNSCGFEDVFVDFAYKTMSDYEETKMQFIKRPVPPLGKRIIELNPGILPAQTWKGGKLEMIAVDRDTKFVWYYIAMDLDEAVRKANLVALWREKRTNSSVEALYVNDRPNFALYKNSSQEFKDLHLTAGEMQDFPDIPGYIHQMAVKLTTVAQSKYWEGKPFPKGWFAEAKRHACRIYNITPEMGQHESPFTRLFQTKPYVGDYFTFGCKVLAEVEKGQVDNNKELVYLGLDPLLEDRILVGDRDTGLVKSVTTAKVIESSVIMTKHVLTTNIIQVGGSFQRLDLMPLEVEASIDHLKQQSGPYIDKLKAAEVQLREERDNREKIIKRAVAKRMDEWKKAEYNVERVAEKGSLMQSMPEIMKRIDTTTEIMENLAIGLDPDTLRNDICGMVKDSLDSLEQEFKDLQVHVQDDQPEKMMAVDDVVEIPRRNPETGQLIRVNLKTAGEREFAAGVVAGPSRQKEVVDVSQPMTKKDEKAIAEDMQGKILRHIWNLETQLQTALLNFTMLKHEGILEEIDQEGRNLHQVQWMINGRQDKSVFEPEYVSDRARNFKRHNMPNLIDLKLLLSLAITNHWMIAKIELDAPSFSRKPLHTFLRPPLMLEPKQEGQIWGLDQDKLKTNEDIRAFLKPIADQLKEGRAIYKSVTAAKSVIFWCVWGNDLIAIFSPNDEDEVTELANKGANNSVAFTMDILGPNKRQFDFGLLNIQYVNNTGIVLTCPKVMQHLTTLREQYEGKSALVMEPKYYSANVTTHLYKSDKEQRLVRDMVLDMLLIAHLTRPDIMREAKIMMRNLNRLSKIQEFVAGHARFIANFKTTGLHIRIHKKKVGNNNPAYYIWCNLRQTPFGHEKERKIGGIYIYHEANLIHADQIRCARPEFDMERSIKFHHLAATIGNAARHILKEWRDVDITMTLVTNHIVMQALKQVKNIRIVRREGDTELGIDTASISKNHDLIDFIREKVKEVIWFAKKDYLDRRFTNPLDFIDPRGKNTVQMTNELGVGVPGKVIYDTPVVIESFDKDRDVAHALENHKRAFKGEEGREDYNKYKQRKKN